MFLASFLGTLIAIAACLITRKKSFGQQCLQAVLRRLPDLLRALRPFLLEQQSEPVDRIEFFSI